MTREQDPLHLLAAVGPLARLQKALAAADLEAVSTDNETLLGAAARGGDLATIQLLIDRGAVLSPKPRRRGRPILQPIDRAAFFGRAAAVELLLDRGAPVGKALDAACHPDADESRELAALLLRRGAPVTAKARAELRKRGWHDLLGEQPKVGRVATGSIAALRIGNV